MIYRVDFSFRQMGVFMNSPVIFGNMARVIFEIMPEKAEETVKSLASELLVSDVFVKGELEAFLTEGRQSLKPFREEVQNLKEKREKYREWKKNQGVKVFGFREKKERIRIGIDRLAGMAEEGRLFYDESWWGKEELSFYIYLENDRWLPLLELVFEILEKTGMGTGISYGKGEIRLKRNEEGSIFIPDEAMWERMVYRGDLAFNLASTIIGLEPFSEYSFYRYHTVRYDGKSLHIVKPPYFLAAGSIVKGEEEGRAGIFEYTRGDMPIYIYNCVFPVRID